jgi:phosphatidylserine/phosphatidylglycerophosphate/cardiolipin synthase-like enzyme
MSPFALLSRPALLSLAHGLELGRVVLPTHEFIVATYVGEKYSESVVSELNQLAKQGMQATHIAYMLKLLAQDRKIHDQSVDLVWTGPEVAGAESRDTGVVVQELFGRARNTIHLASYALDTGQKGQELFDHLAKRMDVDTGLQVRFFINIQRKFGDDAPEEKLLKVFAANFRKMWPGKRLPAVFYDPRALEPKGTSNACLHAKCIVVDERWVFVTSANFTEAAQERNIEAGLILENVGLAKAVCSQFERLSQRKLFRRLFVSRELG